MQVRAGGSAGVADVGDMVTGFDLLAGGDEDAIGEHVPVDRAYGLVVDEGIDDDPVLEADAGTFTGGAGFDGDTVEGGVDRGTDGAGEVDAFVFGSPTGPER